MIKNENSLFQEIIDLKSKFNDQLTSEVLRRLDFNPYLFFQDNKERLSIKAICVNAGLLNDYGTIRSRIFHNIYNNDTITLKLKKYIIVEILTTPHEFYNYQID